MLFLGLGFAARGQINIYLGGSLNGQYNWIRGDEHTFEPGFGGGLSFVYWEYEFWFIKAGLNYSYKSAARLAYPDMFETLIESPEDKVIIDFTEQTLSLPVTVYLRPWEKGNNALLVAGTVEMMSVLKLNQQSEEFGEINLNASEAKTWTKTNLGFGVGYQRKLQKHSYLNLVPSFNLDVRGYRAYTGFMLSVEYILGVY